MNLIGTKEGSSLLFIKESENGLKTIKYDFKDSSFYSETRKGNWRKVLSAGLFFKGISPTQVINSFEDEKYKEFLRVVLNGVRSAVDSSTKLGNVTKVLSYIPMFQPIESWLLLGIKFKFPVVNRNRATSGGWYTSKQPASESYVGINEPINIFQKDVLLFMKELDEEYDETWVNSYKLERELCINLCTFVRNNYYMDLEVYEWVYELIRGSSYSYRNHKLDKFKNLISAYNMEYKALFDYLVTIDRREALSFDTSLDYLDDYMRMVTELHNTRAAKYPKNLTMRHNIVVRNYNAYQRVMVETYSNSREEIIEREDRFKNNIDYSLDWMNDKYTIVSPIDPKEMIIEGEKLHHCVASYVKKVEDGTCQIMFMRDLNNANEPLVTVEIKPATPYVKYREIGMVSRDENESPTEEQTEVLREFAKEKRIAFVGYDPTEDLNKDALKVLKKEKEKEIKELDKIG